MGIQHEPARDIPAELTCPEVITHHIMAHSHTSEEYSEANRQHFNETASTYDDHPQAIQLAHRLSTAMRTTYPYIFDEDSTCLMDYACGTGALVGADLGMRAWNEAACRSHIESAVSVYEVRGGRRYQPRYGKPIQFEGAKSGART